ncbi:MAG TPA: glycosyltransferase [Solirubrobacteraceae bacterium]|jgi:glycosyltransferase involved in cell wall biosynthesis|nr:glycosyltransferase [Solirubrobacteraceae bacterium]
MITVVLAAYNAESWIEQQLESVLAQTQPAAEVIVIDDGSTDDTAGRAALPGVRVLRQANAGAPAAFNRGFAQARTPYVALCAADDVWDPLKLERQMITLERHPEVDLTFGHMRTFGADSERDYRRPATGTGVLDRDRLLHEMFASNVLAAPTAVIRRATWERLGGFREDLPGEDYEFWLRALTAGATFHYDPSLMMRYRVHGESLSAQRWRMLEATYRVRRAYAPAIKDRRLMRRVLAADAAALARFRRQAGLTAPARDAYRAQLALGPSATALAWWAVLSTPAAARAASLRRPLRPRSTATTR